ncbi:MAG: dihydrofolate reductase [Alphaproteobacteria bacterium]|nr:dihydrofolate reductase [Alphaproteobacteria bacterium]
MVTLSLIVAMAENNCIGMDNKMPWHISEDLKRFKALTMGHPVIMGRNTFESVLGYLNKPLPGRENIVISRSGYTPPENINVPVFASPEEAIDYALRRTNKEVFIIGGAQIYKKTLDKADTIHLTQVHKAVDGDAFFPDLNIDEWTETTREDHLDHDPPYSFITLKKRVIPAKAGI